MSRPNPVMAIAHRNPCKATNVGEKPTSLNSMYTCNAMELDLEGDEEAKEEEFIIFC
jgi:hypothetical protein